MNDQIIRNPMMCDPETGVCKLPESSTTAIDAPMPSGKKPVHILYFTDPICSTCWGIEPQLRKLKLEYGTHFTIEYRMGGLLPGWDLYGGSDVRNPTDVAHHWDEVSTYYDMPIDGDVWLEDPLDSSYPPSIAFKAAQLQDEDKALLFLRRIREMVFLEKKNITRWEHLAQAALETGLDTEQLKTDYEGRGKALFQEDLALTRSLGVRGFPTLFFTDGEDNRLKVYGFKPYEQFQQALLSLHPGSVKKVTDTSPEALFTHYSTLTSKEVATLSGYGNEVAEGILTDLTEQKRIGKQSFGKGVLWTRL